jgi:hypothetical protein
VIIRDNLQKEQTISLTYTTTFAAYSFKTVIAVAACFDLKVKQFNIINTFINTKRDLHNVPVAYKLLDRFK